MTTQGGPSNEPELLVLAASQEAEREGPSEELTDAPIQSPEDGAWGRGARARAACSGEAKPYYNDIAGGVLLRGLVESA
eukprot:15464200-Alexandrium_andersonii.AAC.1